MQLLLQPERAHSGACDSRSQRRSTPRTSTADYTADASHEPSAADRRRQTRAARKARATRKARENFPACAASDAATAPCYAAPNHVDRLIDAPMAEAGSDYSCSNGNLPAGVALDAAATPRCDEKLTTGTDGDDSRVDTTLDDHSGGSHAGSMTCGYSARGSSRSSWRYIH